MDQLPAPSGHPASDHPSGPSSRAALPDTRLRGPWLVVARTIWLVLYALNLLAYGWGIVAQIGVVEHPCSGRDCYITPDLVVSLGQRGIGIGALVAYVVGLPALEVLAGFILALLLFWRRSDDWLALLVGLFLVWTVGGFATGPTGASISIPGLPQPANVAFNFALALANGIIYYAVLLLFPDGRFVPRWAWLLLLAWGGQQVGDFIATSGPGGTANTPAWIALLFPVLFLSALGIQIYRFRRVSTGRQRQQTKWIVLGIAVTLVTNVLFWIVLPLVLPLVPAFQQPGFPWYASPVTPLYEVVAYPLHEVAAFALPLSFFLAIQRHHLFDVDALIKRTLVYGTLTALLAAVYFTTVLGAQAVTQRLTGQASTQTVVIVASTLLIAALFTPLRRRLQAGIDRLFYRTKYDAARTLAAFGATLRTETDLSELCGRLVGVVHETMQPESVSLWLREPGQPSKLTRDKWSVGSE